MPIYATQSDLTTSMGIVEVGVASDNESQGTLQEDPILRAIISASMEIESYAEPYGLVPAGFGATELATAGTFPGWWVEACKEIALYRMSLDHGVLTKEKRQRYEDWRMRLEKVYPSTINGAPVGQGAGAVKIVGGGEREFTPTKTGGLL